MDIEETSSAPDAPQPAVAGPGATLRAAREAKRLELSHIAAETRIPLRHLEAIEAENFESLPSRTYAIGFARTYAKSVGLDDVAITEAVRAELADGSMRRAAPSAGMEPGDPARLPSAGLAWAAAAAVLILAIGIFAFAANYFGAGTGPASLLTPEPAPSAAAGSGPVPAAAPAPSGPVVLTALEDGIWVRLYEEGGERLTERTLKLGETIEVPVTAKDPRLNTGRPDALSVMIGGQSAPKLAETPVTVSGLPVSAAALTARGTATPATGATTAATAVGAQSAPRAARRPVARPPAAQGAAEAASETAAAPAASAPAPASEPAAPAGR
ncbi:MAG: helix-turn-helix domain-containing protein [Erythrobacter sp.]|uniref:helix-turn-helix domain-containing protein n=1 Tax=Erythrobacter sp. TaxID=1042 RepID=UPI0025DF3DA1|nr:helix-turn-helix domain-containing protein [Erythrobacter sp.]MCM0000106.1 helix-turn-helix domain-containing protein [Erythrobacter sp.]